MFADIFNVLVFGGRQIILPEALADITGISQYKADDTQLHEQERDTCKVWESQDINLVILGVENQSKPDRDMPFRVIGYDGASYRSQLLKTKEKLVKGVLKQVPAKERSPVVSVVLYFVNDRGGIRWSLSQASDPSCRIMKSHRRWDLT